MTDAGRPLIFALSDSTGETAQQTARAGLAQFGKFVKSSDLTWWDTANTGAKVVIRVAHPKASFH